jgi:hypothetical protein
MELRAPIRVRLDSLYLDPNNPRLASVEKPGYHDPSRLFDERLQTQLEVRMRNSYKGLKALIHSIVNVGWIPVDAMMVWEHPQAAGKYVVVEGNARTTALRAIRRDHDRELKRLAKARGRELPAEMSAIQELEESVEALGRVSAATREIDVYPVAAKSPEELFRSLPRLLGVRHISHAQQWKPYATNVYIYSLYKQIFEENYGDERFRLEEPLLREAGALVSLHSFKVRRAVQAVVAFNRFRAAFDDRLPEGERLGEMDQNYFLYLFEPGHARDQFGLDDGDLWLDRDMEEVLFRWAFSRPREQAENRNVLRSPEDIRTWNKIARYDERQKTHFSRMLDVRRPGAARPMAQVDADFAAHRANRTPLETLLSLVEAMKGMEVETLLAARDEIRPAISELLALGQDYLAMLDAVEGDEPKRKKPARR